MMGVFYIEINFMLISSNRPFGIWYKIVWDSDCHCLHAHRRRKAEITPENATVTWLFKVLFAYLNQGSLMWYIWSCRFCYLFVRAFGQYSEITGSVFGKQSVLPYNQVSQVYKQSQMPNWQIEINTDWLAQMVPDIPKKNTISNGQSQTFCTANCHCWRNLNTAQNTK